MMRLLMISMAVMVLSAPQSTQAQEPTKSVSPESWHQWRGPNANGFSSTANPPLEWNEDRNIKWKVKVEGEGSSTPIIWGDNVFVLSANITDRQPSVPAEKSPDAFTRPPETIVEFVVWNLNRKDGKVKWKKVVNQLAPHEGRHKSTTYAASSPTTDGKHVYALFGSYGLYCLNMDGELIWERNLGKMRTRKGWGEAVSPVHYQGRLIVNWDQEDQSKIFVLDAATGETKWEKLRDEPTTWATPLLVEHRNKTQLITNGTNQLRSYDLDSGDIIWQTRGTTLNAIPCPVIEGTNVICMGGYRGNSAISVSLDSTGPTKDEQLNWQMNRDTPYVPSPVLVSGRLYFTKGLQAILNCWDAKTGEPVFAQQRMPGLSNMYASPVATPDRIYFVSREGTTLVIANSPEFKVLATNKLSEGIDASPAIVGNEIFLRSKTSVYCITDNP